MQCLSRPNMKQGSIILLPPPLRGGKEFSSGKTIQEEKEKEKGEKKGKEFILFVLKNQIFKKSSHIFFIP